MTCHWADQNFVLHSVPLGVFLHEGSSDSESLVDDFAIKIFKDCGFGDINISAMVSDTTGNMNKFGQLLEALHIPHVYCTDHVLQLSAKIAFYDNSQHDERHHDMMKKVKGLVEFISRSNLVTEKLKIAQSRLDEYAGRIPLKILVDVKTRWWSTYRMLERLLYLRKAIGYLVLENDIDEDDVPTEREWNIIKKVCDFLHPFKLVMKQLEGEKYSTIGLVPSLIEYLRKWINTSVERHNVRLGGRARCRDFLEYLIKNIHIDFHERWGADNESRFSADVVRGDRNRQYGLHPVIGIGTVLDPRYKGLRSYSNDDKENIWNHLHQIAIEYSQSENVYTADDLDNDNRRRNRGRRHNRNNRMDNDDDGLALFMMEMNKNDDDVDIMAVYGDEDNVGELEIDDENAHNHHYVETNDEIQLYKRMQNLPIKTNNKFNCPLINFWKVNENKFPVLSQLARKYLIIPATSAPTERLFSTASLVISKKRSRLNPDVAGTQIFLSKILDWYEEQVGNNNEN